MGKKKNGTEEQNVQGEKKKQKKGAGYYISIVITVAAIVVLCIALPKFLIEYHTYQVAKDEYDDLDSLMQVEETTEETTETTEESSSEETTQEEATTDPETGLPLVEVPTLAIDFEELTSINGDFACVLYVPALDMTYPVAYSSDNDEYLHTTFEGTKNASGCIFVDMNASKDFTDLNTILYGHNMKNMTMFGSLKRFSQDETLCASDPYFYLYFEGKTYQYRIFSYYVVSNRDDTVYGAVDDEETYDAFVESAFTRSQFTDYENEEDQVDFSTRPLLVTLSTCFGTDHTENYVVHGALVGVHNNQD